MKGKLVWDATVTVGHDDCTSMCLPLSDECQSLAAACGPCLFSERAHSLYSSTICISPELSILVAAHGSPLLPMENVRVCEKRKQQRCTMAKFNVHVGMDKIAMATPYKRATRIPTHHELQSNYTSMGAHLKGSIIPMWTRSRQGCSSRLLANQWQMIVSNESLHFDP